MDNIEDQRAVIVHLDCDAFFASVHEIHDPSLIGKAVIVGGAGPRSVVTTASYAARKYGVGSAMSMEEARRRCSHAIIVAPQRSLYVKKSTEIWDMVEARVPLLERVGIDEAYADITQWKKPLLELRTLISDIKKATGISLSVGVSPSKLLSKILSDRDKPGGFSVMSRTDALNILANEHPRIIPGVGPKSAAQLDVLGWNTLEVIRCQSVDGLIKALGEHRGAWLYDASRLIGSSTLSTVRVRKSISSETTFIIDIPADDPERLEETIITLARDVEATAFKLEKRGRNVAVKFRTFEWKTTTASTFFANGVTIPGGIEQAAIKLLHEKRPEADIRLLGVRLGSFIEETSLQEPAQLRFPIEEEK